MNTKKYLLALTFAAMLAPAVQARQAPAVEGNVALVSDYRFRGASLSDETLALQGGLDASWESGFYIGTWGSSIEPVGGSELELDLYGGFAGALSEGFGYDVGVLVYTYPGQEDAEYAEIYGSLSAMTGRVESSVGIAYAPEQDNIGGDDNFYAYYAGSLPLTGNGLAVSFGVGYETGAFGDLDGDGDDKIDWTIGLALSHLGLEWGLAYVDTSEDTDGSDATVVLSLGRSF